MQLPDELIIDFLTDFCICRFKDKRHFSEAPPHHYVSVPINDQSSLLLAIFTSQLEKKSKYYQQTNKAALSSLEPVDQTILAFLKKPTIIDCNQAELIRKEELIHRRIDPKNGIEVVMSDIPADLKNKIVIAIKNSPLIKPYIKKLIR